MKAILEFDLNDHDERMAHLRAVKSTSMAIVLFEIQHNLFRGIEENNTSIIEKINDLIHEHGINLDELID